MFAKRWKKKKKTAEILSVNRERLKRKGEFGDQTGEQNQLFEMRIKERRRSSQKGLLGRKEKGL